MHDVPPLAWSHLLLTATRIHMQSSCVFAFFLFYRVLRTWRHPERLIIAVTGAMLLVMLLPWVSSPSPASRPSLLAAAWRMASALRYSVVFALFLLLLTPVLQALTAAYSDTSVVTQAALLCSVHVAFHDYSQQVEGGALASPAAIAGPVLLRGSSALSVNAGIFAAGVLASRLHSHQHVFVFILLAFQLFVGLPLLRIRVDRGAAPARGACGTCVHACLVPGFTAALTVTALAAGEPAWLPWYAAVSAGVLLLGPALYARMYSLKRNMRGPWDVAHVHAKHGLGG